MSGIILPVFIHFCITNILSMMRLHIDAASLTTMAAIVCLPVFLSMYRDDRKRKGEMGWGIAILSARSLLTIVALAIISNLLLTILMNAVTVWLHLSNEVQDSLFGSSFLIQILGIGILCPVMEEVLFRGLVYQRLKAYNEGWFSIVLSAALFAVYHGNAVQMIFAFPMAVIITGIYEHYGTILAPVLFHMAVNLSSVIGNGRF